jgi:hypothetical protein
MGVFVKTKDNKYEFRKVSGYGSDLGSSAAQAFASAINRGKMAMTDVPRMYQDDVAKQLDNMGHYDKPAYTVENAKVNGKTGTMSYNIDGTQTFTETNGDSYTMTKQDDGSFIQQNTKTGEYRIINGSNVTTSSVNLDKKQSFVN